MKRCKQNLSETEPAYRNAGNGGILKLHEDVQTCGYQDVQVMFDMLTSELEAAHARKQPPSPPLAWSEPSSSSSMAGVQ